MKRIHIIATVCLLFICSACKKPALYSGNERFLNGSSAYIFDQNLLHTFELHLPEASLAAIDKDPAAEAFVEGALVFEGETVQPVGIRYK
ncbi:MAG: hypothetical protein AAF570_27885, partial [Bacteroidota bacterium]